MSYRVIPSWPDYEVNEDGDVRRRTPGHGARVGRSQKWHLGWGGYPAVCINRTKCLVHRLVADAFLGPCPPGKEVNHKDSDRLNPSAWNLEYVTRRQNVRHMVAAGRWKGPRGEQASNAKLTEALVREIRSSTEASRVIGERLGVCHKTINEIRLRRKWAHVA